MSLLQNINFKILKGKGNMIVVAKYPFLSFSMASLLLLLHRICSFLGANNPRSVTNHLFYANLPMHYYNSYFFFYKKSSERFIFLPVMIHS